MERPDVDRALAILRRDQPAVVEALRRVLSCTMDQDGRVAVNEVFTCIMQQALQLEHKRTRAAACVRPREGLWGVDGFKSLNHVPDVLLRVLCEISEQPYVTNATTEYLDRMENLHANRN